MSDKKTCIFCNNKLSFFRRMFGFDFCGDECAKLMVEKDLNKLFEQLDLVGMIYEIASRENYPAFLKIHVADEK